VFHINKYKLGSAFMFVFVGVFIVALAASTVVPALAQPLATQKHPDWHIMMNGASSGKTISPGHEWSSWVF
jgi:hypothetical protein